MKTYHVIIHKKVRNNKIKVKKILAHNIEDAKNIVLSKLTNSPIDDNRWYSPSDIDNIEIIEQSNHITITDNEFDNKLYKVTADHECDMVNINTRYDLTNEKADSYIKELTAIGCENITKEEQT